MNIFKQMYDKANRIWSVIRSKPVDCTSQAGRSTERYRRMALTSIASVAATSIGILTALISVPLTVKYLGPERYGMWMTASSIIAMLGFADFGIGNGLLNAVSESDGKDDPNAARIYISSAFFMLISVALLIIVLFSGFYFFIPWPRLFNVISDVASREAGPAMVVFVASLAINMPLGIAQRVQMGYQEGYISHLWAILGALLGLSGVLLAICLKAGLPWLVLAMTGGPTLAVLLNWIVLFNCARKSLFPRVAAFEWSACKKVAKVGFIFLILQVMTLLGNGTDNLVIAQVLGAAAVPVYAITFKLFTITMVAQYFIAPLWPAFGEALARKDYQWARKTLVRALKISFVMGAATAIPLFFFGKQIISLWVGPQLVPSTALLAGLSAFVIFAGYGGVMSTFLNNGNLINRQVVFISSAAIAALLLKVILVGKIGVAGAIWATVIGYSVFYIIPAAKLAYKNLHPQSDCYTK